LTEAALAALCILGPCVLLAQEEEAPPIVWQENMDAALKESYLTGRPLFIHFCPEGRIAMNEDMSTFQDNRIKEAAQHFVWVRLDPEKCKKEKLNARNVEGHAFPEDVFALIKQVLKKVKIAKPKDIEELRRDFDSAQENLQKDNRKKAVSLLSKVARFKQDIGFVLEARKALAAIEEEARQKIEEAKGLVAEGKSDDADKMLRDIENDLRGLDVAAEARKTRMELYRSKDEMKEQLEEEREQQAQKIFNLGQMYEDNKLPEKALAEYEKILEKYPDTKTAGPAADRAKALREQLGKKEEEEK
jgi:tetratricopeptide (TPR) repeat protein